MFKFVFDRRNDSRPWPNLAPMTENPHNSYAGMGDGYPYIVPCRLLLYAHDHEYPVAVSYTDEPIPEHAWYPVGIGWFDHAQDYFGMMSTLVTSRLQAGQLRVLFYYHEGDNPHVIQTRLDALCQQHGLPVDCYRFVSGNTQAAHVDRFVYFADHELFYWRNAVKWNDRSQPGCHYHTRRRTRRFTALNRLHKWWRATIVTDLLQHNILHNSYWSYNAVDMGDLSSDNPIQVEAFAGLAHELQQFLSNTPYRCDELSSTDHNSHWTLVPEHYDDSYVNLVFETFFDADGSGGAFLSEKTFKPIRHAQPFVVFGTPGTLAVLRELGYRCYDHVLDNHYDTVVDNTERYTCTRNMLMQLNQQDLHQVYIQCQADIEHNQRLFLSSKYPRLAALAATLERI